MQYWLLKTEPETFSLDDLRQKGREHWDGVRNFQARNNLRSMKAGDLCLFYHSGAKPSVVGVARVCKDPYVDFTAFDPQSNYFDPKSSESNPTWYMVDVEFVQELQRPVSLQEIKADERFTDMALIKSSRLSVQPVSKEHLELIKELAAS